MGRVMRLDEKVRKGKMVCLALFLRRCPWAMECHGESAGIRAGAVVRSFGGNENIGLFMLSLGSWKTHMEYGESTNQGQEL